MATRKQFCDEMQRVYDTHGMYIGTGNGELTEDLRIGEVKQKEINYGYDKVTTNRNIARDFRFLADCYEKGYDMSESRAGDCSGEIVGAMRRLGIISKTTDYNCRSFQEAGEIVPLNELQPADLVFNKVMTYDSKKKKYVSNASHMGAYVGNGYVIESKGRDAGVVKRKVSEGGWLTGGRLDWFDDDIPVLTRNLYYIPNNMMNGDDVKMCQEQLNKKGYNCGSADGVFGKKTKTAVQAFQLENDLDADGIVGQKTWAKLWE